MEIKNRILEICKNFLTISAFLAAIYSGLWVVGLAPITNSQAENLAKEVIEEKSIVINNKLTIIEQKIQEQNRDIGNLKEQNGRIDERTKSTIQLNNIILEEVRSIRRNLAQ